MRTSKSVLVCGGGIVGLCTAYYLAREGYAVTVVERHAENAHDHCALGSAGYVSPSHVIPLAAPGMVWKGVKWMLNSRSPFYIQPRLDTDLMRWGWHFWRASSSQRVERAAPILRDLCLLARQLYEELDDLTGDRSEFRKDGLLNLCQTQAGLDHETHGLARLANQLGVEARVLDAQQTAAMGLGAKLNIVGAVYFPIDAHLTPARFCPALVVLQGTGREVPVEHHDLRVGDGGEAPRVRPDHRGRPGRRRIRARRRIMVGWHAGGIECAAAHAGGQRLQPDGAAAAFPARETDDPRGAAGGAHADGRNPALWRDDGDRRAQ